MSVASIGGRKNRLIRKALDAVVFAAPETADPIDALTGADGELAQLPLGYVTLGHHTEEEGLNWTREVENSDVRSHGSQEPTRRDIISDVSGLAVIAQETKMQTLEMFNNVDLSDVTPDPVSGEIAFNRSTSPSTTYYRILAVAEDGAGDDKLYFARFLPRASVTEFAEQSWSKSTEVRYELTLTAYVDEDLGYSVREFVGGPGIGDYLVDMGFPTIGS